MGTHSPEGGLPGPCHQKIRNRGIGYHRSLWACRVTVPEMHELPRTVSSPSPRSHVNSPSVSADAACFVFTTANWTPAPPLAPLASRMTTSGNRPDQPPKHSADSKRNTDRAGLCVCFFSASSHGGGRGQGTVATRSWKRYPGRRATSWEAPVSAQPGKLARGAWRGDIWPVLA